MRVGIFGRGRLATAIAEAAAAQGLEVAWQLGREDRPGRAVDVALDASGAEAVATHLDWALATGTDLVIGATGWRLPNLEDRVGQRIGVLVAPNFSLGVALQRRLAFVLARFAALDPSRDLFLEERHHRAKADAPSGTAKALAEALLAGCPAKRDAGAPPPGSAIPEDLLSLSVTRSGSAFGTHTVGLDAPAELLTLTHEARSRAAFGEGALAAAAWLHGRSGCFTFDTFAAHTLDPLFSLEGFR